MAGSGYNFGHILFVSGGDGKRICCTLLGRKLLGTFQLGCGHIQLCTTPVVGSRREAGWISGYSFGHISTTKYLRPAVVGM